MAEIIRADLTTADPGEVSDYLWNQGYRTIRVEPTEAGGLVIDVADIADEQSLTAAMNGFASSVQRGGYISPLPAEIRTHLQHLRDYVTADPATITNAQTVHVVKDLIRAVHYLNKRFETEG